MVGQPALASHCRLARITEEILPRCFWSIAENPTMIPSRVPWGGIGRAQAGCVASQCRAISSRRQTQTPS